MNKELEYKPISILMPVKNAEYWLSQTLAGIAANVGPNDEIVIIDNESSDNTESVIKSELRDYPIKYLKAKGGLAEILNFGMNKCQNQWVARFDADDSYPSNRLTDQRSAIPNADNVAVIFSDYRVFGDGKKYLGFIPTPLEALATEISLFNSQRTPHSGALINKELALAVGGYSQDEFPAEDLGLWLRLAKKYNLVGIPIIGLDYNLNRASITGRRFKDSKRMTLVLNKKYPLASEKLLGAIDSLESRLSLYSDKPHQAERSLLHLIEIMGQPAFKTMGREQKVKVQLKFFEEIFSPRNLISNSELLRYKLFRKIYRKLTK